MPDHDACNRLLRAIDVAHDPSGAAANFALPLFLLENRLGLQQDDGSLMGFSPLVGWVAHAAEQFNSTPLIRPRTAYVGELPDASQ